MITRDSFGRSIDYLRISVTDRCNLRCRYCMPAEGVPSLAHDEVLSFEEIVLLVERAARLGVHSLRITGGEPLVRLGLPDLIEQLKAIEGIDDIALTTNGLLLPRFAQELSKRGVSRVNISLDTLDPHGYADLTRLGSVTDALAGIDAALSAGFDPVKINTVLLGQSAEELAEVALLSVGCPLHVRFIEYMPIGPDDVVDVCERGRHGRAEGPREAPELITALNEAARAADLGELLPAGPGRSPLGKGPARYYAFPGAQGTVGVITARSHHYCATCNRLRLTADGMLRPCLFSDREIPARMALRERNIPAIDALLAQAIGEKPERWVEGVRAEVRDMAQIGG